MPTADILKELKKTLPFPSTKPEIFFALKKIVPLPAIELFVQNERNEFALVKKGEKGGWTLPGGYLGLNEDFESACQRLAQKYLHVRVSDVVFYDVFNLTENIHGKDEGHAVALVFTCRIPVRAEGITYFKKIPGRTPKHHRYMIQSILKGQKPIKLRVDL